ncbi:MAG: alpha/beta fold hydrolase [Chloroflexales bacterium]|nr:alpha/beta fold hydrolase [Chloroflexales bacterium]
MYATNPALAEPMPGELERMAEQLRRVGRLITTPYPIGQTPKELVWTLNKAKLYRYVPLVPPEQRRPVPLLIVYALMSRATILDLRPGNSFIEYMLGKGYDVFLIDWGKPGPEDKDLKIDDYVLDYIARAVRKLKALSGAEQFDLLGYCIGATLSTCYAALRPDDGLRNLLLLTALLDFADKQAPGLMRWVSDQSFDVDKLVERFGVIPGELIDYGSKALKPVENYISSYLRLWDNLDNPRIVDSWHAMNTWLSDYVPVTGAFYRQLIAELYRENRLMEGTLTLRGERVDLGRIRANLLNVTAAADHLVPNCQSERIIERVGSPDKQLLRVPGGHIGVMAGSGALKGTWPKIEHWLSARA